MTKPSDFPVIDADAHVLETERTWDYLEPSEEKYRPQIRSTPGNPRQSWVIDGKIGGFRFPTLSERESQGDVGKNRPECRNTAGLSRVGRCRTAT